MLLNYYASVCFEVTYYAFVTVRSRAFNTHHPITSMSKAVQIYNDLITEGLNFVAGSQDDPSKEKIYVDALQKALFTLYETNLE